MKYIASLPGIKKGILFLPNFSNPYQSLLYRAINKNLGFRIQEADRNILSKELLEAHKDDYEYLHIHWIHPFFNLKNDEVFDSFLQKVNYAKKLGYKIIWTVHNIVSHDSPDADRELVYNKQLAELCDVIFVHGELVKKIVSETYCVKEDKIQAAPHGTYEGIYPDTASRQEAREYFGIKENELTFLYFGRILGYKGLDNLLEIFEKIQRKNKNLRLLIAGQSQYGAITDLIDSYAGKNNRIQFFNGRIDDDKVQYYFKAADICVFPFKKILTSGSVLLSLTFMKPVITCNSGVLPEIITEKTGVLFSDNDQLERALENCAAEWNSGTFGERWKESNFVALRRELSWENIVDKYYRPVFEAKLS